VTTEDDKQLAKTVALLKTQLADSERRLSLHTNAATELRDLVKGLRLSLSHLDPNGTYDTSLRDFGTRSRKPQRRTDRKIKRRGSSNGWKALAVEAMKTADEPLSAVFLQAFLRKKGHNLKNRYLSQWLSACNKDSEDGVVRVGRGLYTCNEKVIDEYAS
jgi:hypothetical protein